MISIDIEKQVQVTSRWRDIETGYQLSHLVIHDLLDFHTTFHEETVDGAGDVWHGKYVQLLCNVM